MPRQDRPVVRGGRLQVKKKRTDRSYLTPTATPTAPVEPQITEEPVASAAEEVTVPEAASRVDPTAAFAPPAHAPAAAAPSPAPAATARAGGAARALQQQGVRKRSDLDLQALARRDTSYALHELRRIGALAVMVVVTLIVLGIVMR